MKISINIKLVTLTILLIAIPGLILGIVGYNAAEKAVYSGIDEQLQYQAKNWRIITEKTLDEIKLQEIILKATAKAIVTTQAKITYELVQKSLDDNKNILSDIQKEDLLDRMNKHVIGQTGYVWILDYEGNYILSKERQQDGENIWKVKDAEGNMVTQDLIEKGKRVKSTELAYHDYPWLNKEETEPRIKIAAIIHFPELGWIIGISTYYDELVDMSYKEKTIENLKNSIADQIIGLSGYIWVLDSEGNYVVSKNRLRDGENINNAKDSNNILFIQEAIKKSKAAGLETDTQKYPWINKGETKERLKIAGLSYVEELDWTIGPSAYYDDFQGEGSLGTVKKTLITIGIIATILGAIIALFFANKISSPIKKMTIAGNKIADGNLNTEIPEIKTGDEVEELGATMSMLVGAIKYLKSNKKK